MMTTCLFLGGAPSGSAAVLCCSARSSKHVSICATIRRSISRCALSRFAAMASISSATSIASCMPTSEMQPMVGRGLS